MNAKKFYPVFFLTPVLILCLMLPDIAYRIIISSIPHESFLITDSNSELEHIGTLENRVGVFEAWCAGSPIVDCMFGESELEMLDEQIWTTICNAGILPNEAEVSMPPTYQNDLVISLNQYPVTYTYIEIIYMMENCTITAYIDKPTNTVIRLQIDITESALTARLTETGSDFNTISIYDDMLASFVEILGLGAVSDKYDQYQAGKLVQRYEACLADSPFKASLTISNDGGLFIFKLFIE